LSESQGTYDGHQAFHLMRFPRLRFSLRTLLIITVLVAIPSAWLGKHWLRTRVQRPIVAKINAYGEVWYDYQVDGQNFNSDKEPPGWAPLRAMLGEDFFATVKVLIYTHTSPKQISDIGLDQLSGLEKLYLSSAGVGAAQLNDADMSKMVSLGNLMSLSINSARIGDAGLTALRGMPKLKYLALYSPNISNAGLSNMEGLVRLRHLELNSAGITDAGLKSLLRLTELENLELRNAMLTDEGLQQLEALKKLKSLTITMNDELTRSGISRLRRQLPECKFFQLRADNHNFEIL
jgi:Leucine-rich repeat (LRR) protein